MSCREPIDLVRFVDGEFTENETRLLLTEPLKHSTIWPRDRERPHFAPEFWGEGGIARVHSEAGGWPHLVQLIAETVVDLLNDSGRRQVDDTLWGQALDEAVVRGHNVFYQLLRGECRSGPECGPAGSTARRTAARSPR